MAAKQGNLDRVKYLVDQGADITKRDDNGVSILSRLSPGLIAQCILHS